MKLPALELRVTAIAREPVELAEIAGSALRGSFAASFRAVSCTTMAPRCDGCAYLRSCSFPAFFASPTERPQGTFPKQTDTPKRYAFRITDAGRTFERDDVFQFELRIVGDVTPQAVWIALGILEMGRRGIGKGRGRFTVQSIIAGTNEECIVENGVIVQAALSSVTQFDLLDGVEGSSLSHDRSAVLIRFLQPTYLRAKGHDPFSPPPFSVLIRAALRRLSSLAALYGSGSLLLPYESLLADSERAAIVYADIKGIRAMRYSSRQVRKFPMEGIVGSIRYDGVPSWAISLLERAAWMGLGKMATHGLGRLEITKWASSSS
jgi:hypothetical protein